MEEMGAPKDGKMFYVRRLCGPYRWKKYKPEGAKQMKAEGRWQESNEYGGWENCDEPTGEIVSLEDGMKELQPIEQRAAT